MRYQTTRIPLGAGYNRPYARLEVTVLSGFARLNATGFTGEYSRELQMKLRAAIRNSGFRYPRAAIALHVSTNVRIDRDVGSDLAVALSVLAADGQITPRVKAAAIGNLGLNGAVLPVENIVGLVQTAVAAGAERALVPTADAAKLLELAGLLPIYPVASLREAAEVLQGAGTPLTTASVSEGNVEPDTDPVMLALPGQKIALEALEIAAAGWHPVMLLGAPGCGKTSLVELLSRCLPPLTAAERLALPVPEGGARGAQGLYGRPFRTPHHHATIASIVGGGRPPEPGECVYADRGILFLDEYVLFKKEVLESLRRPLIDGEVRLARNESRRIWRTQFLCVAAANPCPCGYLYEDGRCRCSAERVNRYQENLTGPLGDRFDLTVRMPALSADDLTAIAAKRGPYVDLKAIRERIEAAWRRQEAREPRRDFPRNHYLFDHARGTADCAETAAKRAARAAGSLRMSARGLDALFKVARTIADLRDAERIETEDIDRALFFKMS